MEDAGGGRLSDDEFEELLVLLRRFCSYELDQWEMWQLETAFGPVYINMSQAMPPGADPRAYRQRDGNVSNRSGAQRTATVNRHQVKESRRSDHHTR